VSATGGIGAHVEGVVSIGLLTGWGSIVNWILITFCPYRVYSFCKFEVGNALPKSVNIGLELARDRDAYVLVVELEHVVGVYSEDYLVI
jgi:hypothetical protein